MHKDMVEQLSEEMVDISPQTIYMGYYSDPYQPCEAEYCQTRKVLELLLKKGFSANILTKSDLVVRDIDLLKRMNNAAVSVSVAFNDNRTRGLFEANTTDTEKRIEALHQLKEAGLKTGALICPVIPYITDTIQLVDMLVPYADVIWIYGLSIDDPADQNWLNVQEILNDRFPDLYGQIEPVILAKDHPFWTQLRDELAMFKKEHPLELNIHV
jgi:hypothetical protein